MIIAASQPLRTPADALPLGRFRRAGRRKGSRLFDPLGGLVGVPLLGGNGGGDLLQPPAGPQLLGQLAGLG